MLRGNEISTVENWLISIQQTLCSLQTSLTEIKEILEKIQMARQDEVSIAKELERIAEQYRDIHVP